MTYLTYLYRLPGLLAMVPLWCLLSACGGYEFRVNERVVYTPLPLFSDFTVADPALHACLVQTINDQNIVRAQDLSKLRCRHAGITDLDGLATFYALTWLDLSHNALVDISPLAQLTTLEMVDLSHNQLQNVSELHFLPRLTQVKLISNPGLTCQTSRTLAADKAIQVALPDHCQTTPKK